MKLDQLWWVVLALILFQAIAGGGGKSGSVEAGTPAQPVYQATAADRHLLAWITYWEARGEPFEGQVAVAAVVLNRVRHPEFPNTIRGVIFERGQFQPVSERAYDPAMPIPAGIYRAVDMALAGHDPSMGALFFYNPRISRNPSFWAKRPVVRQIGNHVFTR